VCYYITKTHLGGQDTLQLSSLNENRGGGLPSTGLVLKKMFQMMGAGFVRHGIFLQRHGLKSVDLFSWLCFPNPAGFLVRQVSTVHLSHHIGCSDAKLEY
jgi:hypothetical protein